MNRICIYPSDVSFLTGKGESTCRRIIRAIKKKNHKEKHQLVTIKEFCIYMGFDYREVFNSINGIKEKPKEITIENLQDLKKAI